MEKPRTCNQESADAASAASIVVVPRHAQHHFGRKPCFLIERFTATIYREKLSPLTHLRNEAKQKQHTYYLVLGNGG